MENRQLDDIVGAGSGSGSFTTFQDRVNMATIYEDESARYGRNSPQAIKAKARLDDVIARLHPMDK